jgi:cysteine-rich repeat protein
MHALPIIRPLIVALCCALYLAQAATVSAQMLSNTQQACVNALNKAGQKVGATQGKDITSCIKDDGNGKLTGMTADDCLTADRKSKVAGAEGKTVDAQGKKCPSFPPYGTTSAATVNTAAKGEELSLALDVFGPTLDPIILTDSAGKACQATVSKTYEKFAATYVKEYNSCKKTRMKDGTITNEAGMEACLGQDDKGKIGKASAKILAGLDKKCVGVTLATAFPGECVPAAGANGTFADCLEAAAVCHMCLAVNEMDAIDRGCDALDDGLLNATCRECGNSSIEAPETCDDGGESASCDSDCTAATCGDSNVNATAGETCDDGDVSDNDTCPTTCTIATCGDGFICNEVGCTTGPTGGNEECDNAGLNSDVTPDACRTNCASPICGDGVIDTGEDCDDSGESATCNADCTTATCGDGIENTTAGEECDDANLSNLDSCLNTCDDAACGDGFTCSAGGCTTGPGAGIEECDDAGANSDVNPDACRTDCANPSCGDTVVDTGEQCDAGGETASCDPNCTFVLCGDGTANAAAGEECDDGGESATCNEDCTDHACGDGELNVTAGEECDYGDVLPGDGCSATCLCGPGSGEPGCNDPLCPARGQLVLYAGTTGITCANNGDCIVGECDTGLGVCITDTQLDTGWTGIAHDADTNDRVLTIGNLLCEGPFAGGIEPCGVCDVLGLNPDTGDCRCSNDNRNTCDQPFVADADDCGGAVCNCYFGPPLPLSSGNTPACVVNRFFDNISGTANVDTGEGQIAANLRSVVYLGISVLEPCPSCGGTCTAPPANLGDPCAIDVNCDSAFNAGDGVCGNFDPIPNDGIRGGTCAGLGANIGQTCDIGVHNTSFPAPAGGAGSSLDCFPDTGKNVSGGGLKISLQQTTGTATALTANVDCGSPPFAAEECPCGVCTLDQQTTCTSNTDCTGLGTCAESTGINQRQNQCADSVCTDVGGGEGNCLANPSLLFCDGITRADGEGFIACNSNADCTPLGSITGNCTLSSPKPCFVDPIIATGVQDPNFPVGVATFCIAATSNGGINSVAGLPGPGRVTNVASAETFCASDLGTNYTPGVGGCP